MLPLEHGPHCLNIDLQFGEIVQFWSKPSHYMWFSHSNCCASDLRSCSGNKIWRFIPKPGVVQFWTHPGKNTVTECLCVGVVFTFLSPLLLLWFLFVSIFLLLRFLKRSSRFHTGTMLWIAGDVFSQKPGSTVLESSDLVLFELGKCPTWVMGHSKVQHHRQSFGPCGPCLYQHLHC